MKRCAYCGRENEDGAIFCRECGTEEFGAVTTATGSESKREPVGPPPLSAGCPGAARGQRVECQGALVVLTRCRTLYEADLIKSRLSAAGLAAFIPDEFLMQVICWNLNA
jgi:hypothetical protein